MNVEELKKKLRESGISDDSYVLDGRVAMDQYVLDREGDQWIVYYEERGNRNRLQHFATEDQACEHLLKWLLKDPTTRPRPLKS